MSWASNLQRKLNAYGYQLADDGIAGPKTWSALFSFMGAKADAPLLGKAAAKYWPDYAINTPLRVAHFISQAAHETACFRFRREIWGPTDAQKGYEGMADIGNTEPGDGFRFRGRGIFQITGRDNYWRYGERIGKDLIANPSLAEEPDTAMLLACLYWDDNGLNIYADRDDARAVGNGINRGNPASTKWPNGFTDRMEQLRKAKRALL